MASRFTALIAVVLGAYGALFFRLYNLQVLHGESYIKQAEAQAIGGIVLADRGIVSLTDKNGKTLPVATNKNFPLVYAAPTAIDDPQETAHALAPLLGLDIETLVRQLGKPDDRYELLARKIDGRISEEVDGLELAGVYVRDVSERYYPFGAMASHVLGFVGPSDKDDSTEGKYGIEKFYNEPLSGTPGTAESGRLVPAQSGGNIQLTIDPNIQIEAEHILERTIKDHGATGGSVIVQDPKTGKLLALGNFPNFDPNIYAQAEIKNFLNAAAQEIYEPGSVFKVITMAAGIDAGKITPQTTFDDTGVLMVSGKKIQNWDLKAHGTVTMTAVLEKSLNTGAAFAERQTGHPVFREYLKKFGFEDETGIDLPGEVAGDLRRLTPNAPAVAYATASFGQGVAVTALEVINAVSAIANGGMLMRPYVNMAAGPQEIRRVIQPETARAVAQMMVSAVDKAEVARIEGYTFAGKTGTAQVPDFVRGGYSDDVIHTYIGFGPTADPKFVVLLKLNKPAGAPLAGTTVVPAFRDLAQFLVNYYNIAPDRVRN
jgi:cell division protein FtsI (penicillin-binding protein 3)/stage V sporulation protein D (sporulation-specific penicillin-binding protein)